MITMEVIHKIRRMKLRDKLSNSAIAKLTGLSRNTVKKWLHAPGDMPPKYRRKSREGKLTAFEASLDQSLKADALRSHQGPLSGRSLFKQIQAQGYQGGYSAVTAFIRAWREQSGKPPSKAFMPLSFGLGEAFQFDWSDKGLTTREREVLAWIGRGWSCRGIATLMGIAPFTVRKHRCNILSKFGLHSTAQLMALAISALQPYGDVRDRLELSARERQVVALVAKGLTSKEIARRLNISPATVRKHRENAMKSIRVRGMASLMWHATGLDDT